MGYRKIFTSQITVFPELYKDIYFDYTKQVINAWLTECFNSYTDKFVIKVEQSSGIAQLYNFDNQVNRPEEFDLRKIWSNPYSRYHIYIYAEGEIIYGVAPSIQPPKEITENQQNNLIFKYQESTKKDGIKMYLCGRDFEVPVQYSSECCDIECWKDGIIRDEKVRADNWNISLNVSKDIFDSIYNLFNDFINYSDTKNFNLEMDDKIGHIEMSGIYTLSTGENKITYFKLLKRLSGLLVSDDLFNIESLNMDFYSPDSKKYYAEKYYFNEANAMFKVRNLAF